PQRRIRWYLPAALVLTLAAALVLTLTGAFDSMFTVAGDPKSSESAADDDPMNADDDPVNIRGGSKRTVRVQAKVTWHAAADNDPPGSREIAYPKSDDYPTIHDEAGGKGTFADPITAAVKDTGTFPIGTRIYYPAVKKYFIVEDSCANCTSKWIDLY